MSHDPTQQAAVCQAQIDIATILRDLEFKIGREVEELRINSVEITSLGDLVPRHRRYVQIDVRPEVNNTWAV